MEISSNGIRLIQSEEGFSAAVYPDKAGNPTIGIGHKLLPGESFPEGVTPEQAQTMLVHDLTFVQNALTQLVPASCNQNQWDALCDFGFNDGVGALRQMLAHGWDEVPEQIMRWDHDKQHGVEVIDPVLKARRAAEVALFNTPD